MSEIDLMLNFECFVASTNEGENEDSLLGKC